MPAVPQSLDDHLVASGFGDALAFAAFYEGAAPRIYGLACRVLGDVHQAEEVAQEVFLELWQTASRFDPGRGSALSWMMRLAHRRAVDRVRSSEAGRRRDASDFERSRSIPYDQTAAAAHASLEAQTIRTALAALPVNQRQALELAYLGGHTHSEISTMLEVPLGTAKTRIRDGLIRLRAVMTPVVAEPA